MSTFAYVNGELYADGVVLADVAREYGTPSYVYSRSAIEANWHSFTTAFKPVDHLVCYAVKANSNIAVLNLLARLGSGFDIVSGGELERVIKAGGDATKVVFSGVGKSEHEMAYALQQKIKCFNVESMNELHRLDSLAGKAGEVANISLRVNPDVDVKTHPYIATGLKENKFGIPHHEAYNCYLAAAKMKHINIVGIDCHIGSQITSLEPFVDALEKLLQLVDEIAAAGIGLLHLDIGGGLGIHYQDESPPSITDYARAVLPLINKRPVQLLIEPGRSIMGNTGVLLTRVDYLKHTPGKNFAIVDAAMNDLVRPALYDAWHDILPLSKNINQEQESIEYDIVGPVCETGDFLGKNRKLALSEGDLLAICSAGAYGFSMSSNYNSRPRPCEIMLDNGRAHEIRRRETITDLYQHETLLSE